MYRLIRKLKDPLYKNSIFLIASSLLGAGTGFVFWVIAARFYSAEDVGLASAIISAVMLLHLFSQMGFKFSLAYYLPSDRYNKSDLINSSLTVVFLTSLFTALVFILGLNIWSPALICIRENNALFLSFILFTILASLVALQTYGVFVGLRRAKYSFIQNLSSSLFKLIALVLLTPLGVHGIFISYGLASLLAFILGLILISRRLTSYIPMPTVKKNVINRTFRFSLGNYISEIFGVLPDYTLPILIINILGARANAYFYIAWSICSILLSIPRWTTHSLIAEYSYKPEKLKTIFLKALKFIFILLIFATICVSVFGKHILSLFGDDYVENSFGVLLILCVSSIPYSLNLLYTTIKRVKEELKIVICVNGCIAILTLVLSYLLVQKIGLIGAGIAWFLGNSITGGIVFSMMAFITMMARLQNLLKRTLKNLLKRTTLMELYKRYRYQKYLSELDRIVKKCILLHDKIYLELYNDLKFFVYRDEVQSSLSCKNEALKYLHPGFFQIFSEIFVKEIYEREYKLKEGDIVVDCGANIGIFTVKAAKIVGENGKVIAIEPEKRNLKFLKMNVEANKLENVIIVQKGLWSKRGQMKLYSEGNTGDYSLFRGKECDGYTIEVDTIDNILNELGIHKVDFIKMDIEGAEIEALKGAMITLKNSNCKLAIAAYHDIGHGPTYRVIVPLLRDLFEIKVREGIVYATKRESSFE